MAQVLRPLPDQCTKFFNLGAKADAPHRNCRTLLGVENPHQFRLVRELVRIPRLLIPLQSVRWRRKALNTTTDNGDLKWWTRHKSLLLGRCTRRYSNLGCGRICREFRLGKIIVQLSKAEKPNYRISHTCVLLTKQLLETVLRGSWRSRCQCVFRELFPTGPNLVWAAKPCRFRGISRRTIDTTTNKYQRLNQEDLTAGIKRQKHH